MVVLRAVLLVVLMVVLRAVLLVVLRAVLLVVLMVVLRAVLLVVLRVVLREGPVPRVTLPWLTLLVLSGLVRMSPAWRATHSSAVVRKRAGLQTTALLLSRHARPGLSTSSTLLPRP